MSIEKANQLKENIDNLLHYYETFLKDGKCRAVKSRKLLKESETTFYRFTSNPVVKFTSILSLKYSKVSV